MLISTTPENRHSNTPTGIKVTGNPGPGRIEDSPKRHALHAVCAAIAASQSIDISSITPDSRLDTFFPRRDRQQRIEAFQDELGVDIDLLAVKNSVEWTVILSANISLAALFFSWKVAMGGLAFTAVAGWLAARYGQELEFVTVGQLAEQVAREHYHIPGGGPDKPLRAKTSRRERAISRHGFQVRPAI